MPICNVDKIAGCRKFQNKFQLKNAAVEDALDTVCYTDGTGYRQSKHHNARLTQGMRTTWAVTSGFAPVMAPGDSVTNDGTMDGGSSTESSLGSSPKLDG
eukprot:SAG11_NODE_1222_length_5484_cov_7.843268_7_plen_100_part_00